MITDIKLMLVVSIHVKEQLQEGTQQYIYTLENLNWIETHKANILLSG